MPKLEQKIELVRTFLQVDGEVNLSFTCYNYDKNGGVSFSGYKEVDGEFKHIEIVMDKNQVELINECTTIMEIYECYKEMEHFPRGGR